MIAIRPIDFASTRDVDAYHRVNTLLHELLWPDNPAPSREALVREHESVPDFATVHRWLAWSGDEVVGHAKARWRGGVDNQHIAGGDVGVLPSWRRQRIGTQLIHVAATAAHAAGRSTMIFDSDSKFAPGAVFLEQLGGKKSLVGRRTRLSVAELDRSLLSAWLDPGRETAEAFEILKWADRVPDEHLEAFVALNDVMNSAPFEDLDFEPFVVTPEQVRAYEASARARGTRTWCVVAKHRETGEFAGFTDMFQMSADPTVVQQGGTGVWPAYRRRGLGRWLKAESASWVLRDAPEAKWFETENAGSNEAMLAINIAMGYKPYKEIAAWQFDVPSLLSRTVIPPAGQDGERVIT